MPAAPRLQLLVHVPPQGREQRRRQEVRLAMYAATVQRRGCPWSQQAASVGRRGMATCRSVPACGPHSVLYTASLRMSPVVSKRGGNVPAGTLSSPMLHVDDNFSSTIVAEAQESRRGLEGPPAMVKATATTFLQAAMAIEQRARKLGARSIQSLGRLP